MISRRHQIEQKASILFMERGYTATSMRDLANALDMEAASLYSHIKAKEEILHDICFRMADEFFTALNQVFKQTENPDLRLRLAIIGHVKVILKDVCSSAVFINEWKHLNQNNLNRFLKLRLEYEMIFMELIKVGLNNVSLKNTDEKFLAQHVLSSINGAYSWYNPSGKLNAEEIGAQLADLLLYGIKNKMN